MLLCLDFCLEDRGQGSWRRTALSFRRRLGLLRPLFGEHGHDAILALGNGFDKFRRLRANFANFLWDLITGAR